MYQTWTHWDLPDLAFAEAIHARYELFLQSCPAVLSYVWSAQYPGARLPVTGRAYGWG